MELMKTVLEESTIDKWTDYSREVNSREVNSKKSNSRGGSNKDMALRGSVQQMHKQREKAT